MKFFTMIRHKYVFATVTKKIAVNGTGYPVLIFNFKSLLLRLLISGLKLKIPTIDIRIPTQINRLLENKDNGTDHRG